MNLKQHSIKEKVSVSGVGLHTGEFVTLSIVPAPINHGIVFQRVDIEGKPVIPADVDYVVDTPEVLCFQKTASGSTLPSTSWQPLSASRWITY
jgi:UDP-3-O-[3-hydroxymyristoyl] N-acetylglucosamine deacetylase/3-hydroxyacyl-[acyl-carrier-protein] dehydratase